MNVLYFTGSFRYTANCSKPEAQNRIPGTKSFAGEI
jgi:hypothetical protein